MCLGTAGIVVRVWDEDGVPMAMVAAEHGEQEACLLYAPDVDVGAAVLVHLGSVVDEIDPEVAGDVPGLGAAIAPPGGERGGRAAPEARAT